MALRRGFDAGGTLEGNPSRYGQRHGGPYRIFLSLGCWNRWTRLPTCGSSRISGCGVRTPEGKGFRSRSTHSSRWEEKCGLNRETRSYPPHLAPDDDLARVVVAELVGVAPHQPAAGPVAPKVPAFASTETESQAECSVAIGTQSADRSNSDTGVILLVWRCSRGKLHSSHSDRMAAIPCKGH